MGKHDYLLSLNVVENKIPYIKQSAIIGQTNQVGYSSRHLWFFTLPDTATEGDTDTDKMCTELNRNLHQSLSLNSMDTSTQFLILHKSFLSVSVSVAVSASGKIPAYICGFIFPNCRKVLSFQHENHEKIDYCTSEVYIKLQSHLLTWVQY